MENAENKGNTTNKVIRQGDSTGLKFHLNSSHCPPVHLFPGADDLKVFIGWICLLSPCFYPCLPCDWTLSFIFLTLAGSLPRPRVYPVPNTVPVRCQLRFFNISCTDEKEQWNVRSMSVRERLRSLLAVKILMKSFFFLFKPRFLINEMRL